MQVLLPVFVLGMIGFYAIPSSHRKMFGIFYCMVLATVAFCFIPHSSDDLYREFDNLRGIQQQGWKYFSIKGNQYYATTKFEGLYLTQLYYYIMAQLPSVHFLPAITTFIVYFLQFRIIEKVSKRYSLTKLQTFCLYAFVLCTRETYMIMSGIRNHLAFTIAGYLLYTDLIEKRKRIVCVLGYIAMVFVHQSSVFILLFRLLVVIKNKKIRFCFAGGMLIWSVMLETVNNLLARFSGYSIFNSIIHKVNIYTVNNGGNADNIILRTRYLIYMLVWIPVMVLVFAAVQKARKYADGRVETTNKAFFKYLSRGIIKLNRYPSEVSANDINDIGWFVSFNICFTIGSVMYYWLYLRSAMLLGIVGFIPSAILFYDYNEQAIYTQSKKNHVFFILFMVMIKLLVIMFYMNRNMSFGL